MPWEPVGGANKAITVKDGQAERVEVLTSSYRISIGSTLPDRFQWAAQDSTAQHWTDRALGIKIRGPHRLNSKTDDSGLHSKLLHRQNRAGPESADITLSADITC